MTTAPRAPTFIVEHCRVCDGSCLAWNDVLKATGLCLTCGGTGRWLRNVYDEVVSGEMRLANLPIDVELHIHRLATGRPVDERAWEEFELARAADPLMEAGHA